MSKHSMEPSRIFRGFLQTPNICFILFLFSVFFPFPFFTLALKVVVRFILSVKCLIPIAVFLCVIL